MRHPLHTVLLIVSSAAVLCLTITVAAVWRALAGSWFATGGPWRIFGLTFCTFLAAYAAGMGRLRLFRFLATLDHESIHAFFGAITFAGVQDMHVSSSGEGSTSLERPNFLAAIAPYVVSQPLVFAISLYAILPAQTPVLDVMLGIAFAYHVVRVVADTASHGKTDFRHATLPGSALWLVASFLFFGGLVAALVTGRWSGAMEYVNAIVEQMRAYWSWLYITVRDQQGA